MPILTSKYFRVVLVITAAASAAATASPAFAEDNTFNLSANAALVSDYRFRGISLSDKDPALQGGFDLETKSGFYVGTWGSSIESYEGSELELDVYGGYAANFGGLDFDIGILAYTYPGSSNTTYWEAYSSVGGSAGIVNWTLGAAYAFDQKSIGDDDNIYLYLGAGVPIANTPLTLSSHIAYEDGAFGTDKWDWALGITYNFQQFSLSLSYIDTNVNSRTGKGGVVASLSTSF